MIKQVAAVIKRPVMRFLIVGGLAAAMEYGSFLALFHLWHMALILANGISFCLGLLTSFLLNRIWTFATKSYRHKIAHQFGMYITLSALNLGATLFLVSFFKWLDINPNLGKLLAMAITSSWNFVIFKLVIFRRFSRELLT